MGWFLLSHRAAGATVRCGVRRVDHRTAASMGCRERTIAATPAGALRMIAACCMLSLCGCTQLPALQGRSASSVIEDTGDTRLGAALQPLVQAHAPLSGVVVLAEGRPAFAARAALAQAAQRTLDLQYYIWRNDASGGLLFDALRRAADRGVRVRLLLDDNNSGDSEAVLRALDAHPNIEVRLFNPFLHRQWRALDFLTDFARVNRRMHNKSFTADNQVSIVGGRNIGDEYFDGDSGTVFVDLDVLAVGAVVPHVSRDFDRYWASDSSYPLASLPAERSAAPEATAARAAAVPGEADAAAPPSPLVRDLLAGTLAFEWAPVAMVSDDPAKGLGLAAESDLLWARLQSLVPAAASEVQLVSPYFVPRGRGAELLGSLARRGVRVTVLTNALEATDVPAVHAGYAAWRRPLLQAGIQLFERKRTMAPPSVKMLVHAGSSGSSLHAKTFVIDRAHLFIGSFNFDPRSARLNTELGFVIDSPVLAAAAADRLARRLPEMAYRLQLHDGRIEWEERRGDGVQIYHADPHAGLGLRLGVWALSLLPIGGLL
jgi:putative cardiolipin synthase